MNRYHLRSVLAFLLVGVTLAAQPGSKTESPEILLERAIQKQTVDGDLKAAIDIYKKILERTRRNRPVEAKALLRLGQCQEKLGQAEAIKAYDRLVKDYADQSQEANVARERLAALKEVKSGEVSFRRVLEMPRDRYGNAVSYNGKYLMTTLDAQARVSIQMHDLATGETRTVPRVKTEPVIAPCLSPDGSEFIYKPIYNHRSNELRIARTDGSADRVLYIAPEEFAHVYPYGYSPDGKQHLVEREYKDGRIDFAVLSFTGGAPRILKVPGRQSFRRAGAAFSPDGKFIAYDAFPTPSAQNHDIYIGSIESGQQTLLTDDPADDSLLGWAPDGSGILFRTDRAGTQDAYFLPMRGAQPSGSAQLVKRNIGRISTSSLGFTWDGRVFYRIQAQAGGFYLGHLNESGTLDSKPVYSQEIFGGPANFPAWSADGSMLAFRFQPELGLPRIAIKTLSSGAVSMLPLPIGTTGIEWLRDKRSLVIGGWDNAQRSTVILLDTKSGERTVVAQTNNRGILFQHLAVSSDGKHLYFQEFQQAPVPMQGRIVQWDIASRKAQTIFEPGGPFGLSPDGRSIAIIHSDALKIVNLSDRSSREVAQDAKTPVAWSPDGSSILFQRNQGELWRVPSAGGPAVKVGAVSSPFWQLKIHPDGRQIALVSSLTTAEIWVAENLLSTLKAGSR